MNLSLCLTPSEAPRQIEVADTTFGVDFNEPLVHQVVVAYLSGARAGTKKQKTRSEVRGGGAKPWKQKGTGRARAGTIRSPLWRKGGRIFAAVPRSFVQKVNKKMYRGALKSILSELVRQDRLKVVESLTLAQPKTSLFVEMMASLNLSNKVLIIEKDFNEDVYLASRNLLGAEYRLATEVDPVSLIKYEHVLATVDAVRQLEEAFA